MASVEMFNTLVILLDFRGLGLLFLAELDVVKPEAMPATELTKSVQLK